jgi:hypothetical protein
VRIAWYRIAIVRTSLKAPWFAMHLYQCMRAVSCASE